ncbi:aspartyl/asparaginyl beta-hydroxylase domain-containing protein [Pedobacter sp. PLR]|uniref:aspartyl/asparaginyl beta-hydroxylase domain-containing protein n=1 Tax=Pedobacter sp. PLR TaxID=2994465 RepID=UPI0022462746|nr:aspartyl/asparaginyl beta-hydroxylase domain-containing protein [Pedobacter sp. PLR]MCX2452637.1 aspartyl/asparaginyl beta-hydroxylase domain-containing protein [Pedobacter sp. PLR]
MHPSHLKFNFSYDRQQLQQELNDCLQQEWPVHFNTKDFNGDWRSISLRSSSGRSNDIYAHGGSYQDTPLLQNCPYFSSIIESWKCEKEAIRLLALAPGSVIKPHRDRGCSYPEGSFRIHIPIVTNSGVHFIINEQRLHLQEGECWYLDFNETHSIVNEGDETRVHLIIDGIRNAWTDELFKAQGYPIQLKPKSSSIDEETKLKIIAQLELMDTDTARSLISNMRNNESTEA